MAPPGGAPLESEERRTFGDYTMILPLRGGERLMPTKKVAAAELSKVVVDKMRAREEEFKDQGMTRRRQMDVAGLSRKRKGANQQRAAAAGGGDRLDLAGSLANTDAILRQLASQCKTS
eukprot:SAG22_NODE_1865_length_3410_cov_2.241921_1_plen_119_part_00